MILLPPFALLLAAVGTAWLARPGNRLSAVALPEERSLHERATPTGAGLAVVIALVVSDVLLRWVIPTGEPGSGLLPHLNLVAALLLIAGVSWADDRRPLAPNLRLSVHTGAAFLLVGADLTIGEGLLATCATLLMTVWSINLFNFMDGMDGFAGGMAVIGFGALAALGMTAGADDYTLAALTVTGAYAGFLAWNFPPARIFLGDVGSASLGLLAASFSLWGVRDGLFAAPVPILIFAPFWVDASLTLLRRLFRREKIWHAHCTHAYQRLARAGWGHRKTTLWEYALMLICAAAAAGYQHAEGGRRLVILAGAALIFLMGWLLVRSVERQAGGRKGHAAASQS
jgi:UDP-N-acetylmuramyl pentapeptide phosphotransferase/UDP-N-acetylglucosamine-1-phosphate transferase